MVPRDRDPTGELSSPHAPVVLDSIPSDGRGGSLILLEVLQRPCLPLLRLRPRRQPPMQPAPSVLQWLHLARLASRPGVGTALPITGPSSQEYTPSCSFLFFNPLHRALKVTKDSVDTRHWTAGLLEHRRLRCMGKISTLPFYSDLIPNPMTRPRPRKCD